MLENYFDKQFELRYFEMNNLGVASPMTILTLLEEAAADHCCSINKSLYSLKSLNVGWVLLSGAMQIDRYPRYKEKITIRTWLSGYSTVKGFRENIIYDEQGHVIGRAKGLWVFFDIVRRRPVQIFDDIKEQWGYCNEVSFEADITEKIEAVKYASYMQDYNVSRIDTDMNKHVNNIRYLQWAIDSIPEEIIANYFLQSINGRFVGEAQFGDTIRALTIPDSNELDSFMHTVRIQGNDKVCATAKTSWKKIE